MDIDHEAPAYLYETLANLIAHRIEIGELEPNSALPGESRLAREYGVSLGTARSALRVLREQGLVVTLRHKGTYVAKREKAPPARLWSPG